MQRLRHFSLPLIIAVVTAIAGTVWIAGDRQRQATDKAVTEKEANRALLKSGLDRSRALEEHLATGHPAPLKRFRESEAEVEHAVATLDSATTGEADEQEGLQAQVDQLDRWETLTDQALGSAGLTAALSPAEAAAERARTITDFEEVNQELHDEIEAERVASQRESALTSLLTIVGLCSLVILLGAAIRSDDRRKLRARRFAEALQAARTETEAYGLMREHLQREVKGDVAVFNRNNSADRLEASTPLPPDSPLRQKLEGAKPGDCLAVRTARPSGGGTHDEDILRCEICGLSGGASLCVPSIVGGEVIGAVLVRTARQLSEPRQREVEDGVVESSPVIAHLRNLAIAERKASSDLLTGLPNKRAAEETVNRMVAQAGRSLEPLGMILFDLDHFKRVNDSLGHPKGDEVLAAVGAVTSETIRESDFAARFGGEEFIVLLPESDRAGALTLAEKLRGEISELKIPGLEGGVTASFGVAALPDDAISRDELLRMADRALYGAKRSGRNKVQALVPAGATVEDSGEASPESRPKL